MLFEALANGFKAFLKAIKEASKAAAKVLAAAAVAVGYLALNAAKIVVGVPFAAAYTFVAGVAIVGITLAGAGSDFVYRKNGQKRTENTTVSGILSSIGSVWGFATSPITNLVSAAAESMTDTEKFGSKTTPAAVGEVPVSLRSTGSLANSGSAGILDHQRRGAVSSTGSAVPNHTSGGIDEGFSEEVATDSAVTSDGAVSTQVSASKVNPKTLGVGNDSLSQFGLVPENAEFPDEGVVTTNHDLDAAPKVRTKSSSDLVQDKGDSVVGADVEIKSPVTSTVDRRQGGSNQISTGANPSQPLVANKLQKNLDRAEGKFNSVSRSSHRQ